MSKRVFLATGLVAIIGGLATSAFVASCDTVCTTEARASVWVHIVDESGEPVGAEWVSFTVDEEAPRSGEGSANPAQSAECVDEDCTEWVAGFETEGTFVVNAMVCGREVTGRATVELTDDGCHVETEHLVLEADTMNCDKPRKVDLATTELVFPEPKEPPKISAPEPETCSNVAYPSVMIKIARGDDSSVTATTPQGVYYQIDGGVPTAALCMDDTCSLWAAGWEEPGTFDIHALYANKRQTKQVEVGMSKYGCHVDTQNVTFVFEPEPADLDEVDEGPFLTNKPRECTYEARPSVIVDIVDGDSEVAKPVEAKSVWWEIEEIQSTTRALCVEEPCSQWFVGIEQAGEFDIFAEVCGQTLEAKASVEHTADGCHVDTERVTIVADIENCPQ